MHSFPDRENRFNYPGDWADPDIGWSRNEMIETLADMANMPLTVETLQILCDAIYEDPEAPPTGDRYAGAKALFWDRRLQRAGWRIVVQPEMDARTGYCGVAIYHPASNTVIIVNRGTDFSKALREPREALLDIGADRDIHNGRSTDQFEYANQFLQRTKRGMRAMGIRAPIVVTGHSLGGALAQLQLGVSLVDRNFRDEDVLDVVGVTFAALGADNSVIRYLQEKSATYGYFDPSNVRTESWEKLRNYVRRGDGFTQRYEVLFDEPRTLVLGTDRLLSALDLADMKKAEDAFNNPFDDRFFGLNNTDEAILARRNAAFLTLFRLYMKNHDHRNYYSREFVVPLAEAFPAYRPGRY